MEEITNRIREEKKGCILCKEGKDKLYHFVAECKVAKGWLKD